MKSTAYINFVKEYASLDAKAIREKFFIANPTNPRNGRLNDAAIFKFIKDVKEVFGVKFFSEGTYSLLATDEKQGFFPPRVADSTGTRVRVVEIKNFYEINGEGVMDEIQSNPDYEFIRVKYVWGGKDKYLYLTQFIRALLTARLQVCHAGDFDYDKYMESKDVKY